MGGARCLPAWPWKPTPERENPPFLLRKEGFILELFFLTRNCLLEQMREGLSLSRSDSRSQDPSPIFIRSKDQAHWSLLLEVWFKWTEAMSRGGRWTVEF